MRKFLARRFIERFGKRYHYDVSYMRYMLETSPAAFFKFAKFTALSRHGEEASTTALFVARIAGSLAEDCGPCVQLGVNMAREAGVDAADIAAVLRREASAMSSDAGLAYRFADAVLNKLGDDDARDAVRARWGEAGVVDLTIALQSSRFYPMVKAGLGFAKSCQRVEVDGSAVDVVRRAA